MMYFSRKKVEATKVSFLNVTTIITSEDNEDLMDMAKLRKGFRIFHHYHQTVSGTQENYPGPFYFVVTDNNVKT